MVWNNIQFIILILFFFGFVTGSGKPEEPCTGGGFATIKQDIKFGHVQEQQQFATLPDLTSACKYSITGGDKQPFVSAVPITWTSSSKKNKSKSRISYPLKLIKLVQTTIWKAQSRYATIISALE